MLGDVKTVFDCRLAVPHAGALRPAVDAHPRQEPSVAAERRAGSVAQEYRLAKACDEGRFVEAGSGLPALHQGDRALRGDPRLAVGLFAECSELWDVFAHIFADERAASAKRNSGTVTDCQQLRACVLRHDAVLTHPSQTLSLADPLATADSRAEKPKPIIGLFAPSLSYRSRSRAACIA